MQNLPQKKNKYYNWNRTLSYNALFHLIITERNLGKTYGLIIKLLRFFIYKKEKSVILTKFKNEIDCKIEETLQYSILVTIEEIMRNKVDRVIDRIHNVKLNGRHIMINSKVAFSFYSISEAESIKKLTILKTYDNIWHDECLRFDRYVPNEIFNINTIYQTVDRKKFTTKLFLTGNAISRYNPYIEGYNLLEHVKSTGYTYIKDRDFLIHISNDKAFQEEEMNSATVKLAGRDSKYVKMATEGQFTYDNNEFVVDTISEFKQHYFMLLINEKEICFSKIRYGYYLHTRKQLNRVVHNKFPSRSSTPITKDNMENLKLAYNNSLIFYENIDIKKHFEREYMGVINNGNKR